MERTVAEFYTDKYILVTGGTGFLGKVSKLIKFCLIVNMKYYLQIILLVDFALYFLHI